MCIRDSDYIAPEDAGTTKEALISELGGSDVQSQNRFNVTETNLPPERRIVLLNKI